MGGYCPADSAPPERAPRNRSPRSSSCGGRPGRASRHRGRASRGWRVRERPRRGVVGREAEDRAATVFSSVVRRSVDVSRGVKRQLGSRVFVVDIFKRVKRCQRVAARAEFGSGGASGKANAQEVLRNKVEILIMVSRDAIFRMEQGNSTKRVSIPAIAFVARSIFSTRPRFSLPSGPHRHYPSLRRRTNPLVMSPNHGGATRHANRIPA